MKRKGFIATLEAIIASTMFLIFIATVIPTFVQPEQGSTSIIEDRIDNILSSLDNSGKLGAEPENITELESTLSQYLQGYQLSVGMNYLNLSEGTHAGGETINTFQVNKTRAQKEVLRLWIDEASGLDVRINGETVLTTSQSGYYSRELSSYTVDGENTANITSDTANLDYQIERLYYAQGNEMPSEGSITSLGYLIPGTNNQLEPKEIRVFVWR
ncbi:MAG: hypothetical protein MUP58_01860 [Candidatus Nanohaloarchaeota archaeon QJJ-9]|nr:hypothetical protein [Candidatus Nanohaloarchaeota archaeon QJJ-9]